MRLANLLLLGALLAAAAPLACGTDAVGVSQCRTIEQARCRAGAACGLVDDVDACIRFSRDQCLHGTATAGSPKKVYVNQCVGVLDDARDCALDSRKKRASSCGIDLVSGAAGATVCDVITEPEKAQLCSFLLAEPVETPAPSHEPDAGSDAN